MNTTPGTPFPSSGIPWANQELGCSLVDFIVKVRTHMKDQLATTGRFDFKDTDHNSPNYCGISNKMIIIAAGMLDPACKTLDYEEKKKVLLRAIG